MDGPESNKQMEFGIFTTYLFIMQFSNFRKHNSGTHRQGYQLLLP